jgi:hypothetical protein
MGLERGTQLREYNWGATWEKSSGSCLENQKYGRKDPSRWPLATLYLLKVGNHFAGKRRSLGRCSLLADSDHGGFFSILRHEDWQVKMEYTKKTTTVLLSATHLTYSEWDRTQDCASNQTYWECNGYKKTTIRTTVSVLLECLDYCGHCLSWKSSQNSSTPMLFLVTFAGLKNSRTHDYIVEKASFINTA